MEGNMKRRCITSSCPVKLWASLLCWWQSGTSSFAYQRSLYN